VVAMWLTDFPALGAGLLPAWQMAQAVPATTAWSIAAGLKVSVLLWQLSQGAVPVGMWSGMKLVPLALTPLWHVAQVPGCTALWLKVTRPSHEPVV